MRDWKEWLNEFLAKVFVKSKKIIKIQTERLFSRMGGKLGRRLSDHKLTL
jgi:hypothetical protein